MNRNAHMAVGGFAGGFAALYMARSEPGPNSIIESLGGMIGGILGGRFPDVIDPPTHPGHRSIGHGVLPAGAGLAWLWTLVADAQAALRKQARVVQQGRLSSVSSPEQLVLQILEWLLLLASGAVVGFPSGYASHLVLDIGSPAGLPIVA